jgi:hypothetical protein
MIVLTPGAVCGAAVVALPSFGVVTTVTIFTVAVAFFAEG